MRVAFPLLCCGIIWAQQSPQADQDDLRASKQAQRSVLENSTNHDRLESVLYATESSSACPFATVS